MSCLLKSLVFVGLLVLAGLFLVGPVVGEDEAPQDPRKVLEAAIERGRELYTTPWVEGGKACAECHGEGANKMRATRLKSYPKYDFVLKQLLTGQQKLNHMIETQAKGEPLPLGHEKLTALEAYISTLR